MSSRRRRYDIPPARCVLPRFGRRKQSKNVTSFNLSWDFCPFLSSLLIFSFAVFFSCFSALSRWSGRAFVSALPTVVVRSQCASARTREICACQHNFFISISHSTHGDAFSESVRARAMQGKGQRRQLHAMHWHGSRQRRRCQGPFS